MTLLKLGSQIRFQEEGISYSKVGVITRVDDNDSTLPYYVTVDADSGAWISQSEVLEILSDLQLNRIEAKLDAIIAHFNISFEE